MKLPLHMLPLLPVLLGVLTSSHKTFGARQADTDQTKLAGSQCALNTIAHL